MHVKKGDTVMVNAGADKGVKGEVLKNGKNKKIKVFKYKCKDRSNRVSQGHRQPYTKIKITKIG